MTKDEALLVVARCAWRCRAAQRKLPCSFTEQTRQARIEEDNLDHALAALAKIMPGPS